MKKHLTKKYTLLLLALGLLLSMILSGCYDKKPPVEIVLMPEDAILDYASDVILEPDKPPYNLGGWQEYNEVYWEFVVPKKGFYKIILNYSRPGNEPEAGGLITLGDNGDFSQELNFKAKPTGANSSDWSVYKINDSCCVELEPGKMYLSIQTNYASDYEGTDYFINLRSVTLRMEKDN